MKWGYLITVISSGRETNILSQVVNGWMVSGVGNVHVAIIL